MFFLSLFLMHEVYIYVSVEQRTSVFQHTSHTSSKLLQQVCTTFHINNPYDLKHTHTHVWANINMSFLLKLSGPFLRNQEGPRKKTKNKRQRYEGHRRRSRLFCIFCQRI